MRAVNLSNVLKKAYSINNLRISDTVELLIIDDIKMFIVNHATNEAVKIIDSSYFEMLIVQNKKQSDDLRNLADIANTECEDLHYYIAESRKTNGVDKK